MSTSPSNTGQVSDGSDTTTTTTVNASNNDQTNNNNTQSQQSSSTTQETQSNKNTKNQPKGSKKSNNDLIDNKKPRTQSNQNNQKKELTEEQKKIQKMHEEWQFIVREVPTEELIFDQEGMPFISNEDLETTIRTLQLFYRFPQVAMAGTYTKNTYENFMYQQVRSNAMRWLKPADAPAVKDILALIKVQEQSMMQSTGIRNERNRKKRLLPKQSGQVYINHNEHELLMYNQAQKEVLSLEHKTDDVGANDGNKTESNNNNQLITTNDTDTVTPSDGVVSLKSQASAPIQKMIKIHGIEAYTTHDSLPESAKLNHVLDNDSSVIKATSRYNVPLCEIRKNFVPITKDNAAQMAQKMIKDKKLAQGNTKNNNQHGDGKMDDNSDDSIDEDIAHIQKRQRVNSDEQPKDIDNNDDDDSVSFFRQKHKDNYDALNPQPKAEFIKPAENSVEANIPDFIPKIGKNNISSSKYPSAPSNEDGRSNSNPSKKAFQQGKTTIEIEEVTDDDDEDNNKNTSKNTIGPQFDTNNNTTKRKLPSQPILTTTNDTSVMVGLPEDSAEMIKEHENDQKIAVQLPANPNSRFAKGTKQQAKEWSSKRGLYGGTLDVGVEVDLDGEEIEQVVGLNKTDKSKAKADINHEDDDLYYEDDVLKAINTVFNPKNPITKQKGPVFDDDGDDDNNQNANYIQQCNANMCDEEEIPDDEITTNINETVQNDEQADDDDETAHRTLRRPLTCYICKASFTQLHHFYDRMCPSCASFNYKKRFQTAPMALQRLNPITNKVELVRRVCLVTGARVKIGYEIVLKLLRAGAFVIATSRFPIDTALRLTQEEDFAEWEDNVHVYGLDFRVVSSVELFIKHILSTYPRLDMIMNNAAQTIRRPPQFYRHLLQVEAQPVEEFDIKVAKIVKDFIPKEQRFSSANTQFTTSLLLTMGVNEDLVKKTVPGSELLLTHNNTNTTASTEGIVGPAPPDTTVSEDIIDETNNESMNDGNNNVDKKNEKTNVDLTKEKLISLLAPTTAPTATNALTLHDTSMSSSSRLVTMLSLPQAAIIPSSLLTQIPLVQGDEDKKSDAEIFPVGIYDKDHQQLDLRPQQTWVLKAAEVSMVEMQEVQTVNATIPFMLNTKLKPLMASTRGDPSWIINVSSMEGKFRGHKDITHPHTNMAKAALNMFTHTSAKDFAIDNIFMNAVDTGWVTEELPHGIAVHKAQLGFAPPLDEIDGAARCLDPIFTSLLTGVYEYGKFFKDYAECHW